MDAVFPRVVAITIAVCALAGCGRSSRPAEPPDLLLVTLDTTRPDHLGCYGGRPTPAIDNLARQGIVFQRAIAQAPLTLPAHASIFTGLYPTSHGVRDNGRFVLEPRFETLAEILAARGYSTGAAVGAFPVAARFGLNQGFALYDEDLAAGRGSGTSFRERPAEAVNRAALAWLGKAPPGRFFLWVHYFDPHMPYDPPSPWKEQFHDNPYDGEIAYADHQLGELLAGLESLGRRANTLVVVLADHGESMGDHQETTHGLFVYDATIRIPMILSGPASLRKRITAGGTVESLAQEVDVVPTVLDLMGMPIPPGLDGQSLAPLLRGDRRAADPGGGRVAYSETFFPWFGYGWSELRTVQDGRWKYIAAPRPELYDVANDPQELRNLAGANAPIVKRLARSLDEIERRDRATPASSMDAETAARLRSLGYIGGNGAAPPDTASAGAARIGAPPGAPDPKDMVRVYLMVLSGEEFMSHHEPRKAATLLRRAVELDPRNVTARLYLAQSLLEMRELDKALKEFRAVHDIDPGSAEALVGIAAALFDQGRMDEAAKELDLALQRRPGYGLAHFNRGLIEAARGNLDRAREILALALQESPFLAEGWTRLGELNYRQERWSEARSAFERALQVEPGQERALRGLQSVAIKEQESTSR